MRVDYDKDQLAYALANALKERDEAQNASEAFSALAWKLEGERNEARKELEEYRSIAENIGAEKAVSEKEQAIRERDEWAAMCGRYKQERDEAIRLLKLCADYTITTYQEKSEEFLKQLEEAK